MKNVDQCWPRGDGTRAKQSHTGSSGGEGRTERKGSSMFLSNDGERQPHPAGPEGKGKSPLGSGEGTSPGLAARLLLLRLSARLSMCPASQQPP